MKTVSVHAARLPVAWVVPVAFGFAAVMLGLLPMISQPDGSAGRAAHLDADIARLEAHEGDWGPKGAYPPGALCQQNSALEAAQLKGDVEGLARKAGATVVQVAAETDGARDGPPPKRSADARVTAVRFTLEMNASATGATNVLKGLATYSPLVLIDRADLASRSGYLHTHLSGHVLCRA